MADKNSDNKIVTIVVPLVVAALSLLGVLFQTDWFSSLVNSSVATTLPEAAEAVAAVPTDEAEATMAPPTETVVSGTDTPIPLPLEEIFPQVGEGTDFDYANDPAIFTGEILPDECVHTGVYGLKMIYGIKDSGSGGWGVLWANAPGGTIDLSTYSTLVFWVKGGSGDERFQVTFSDSLQQGTKVESADMLALSQDWQEVRVPLSNFEGVSLSLISNITFDFRVKESGGLVCVDDISFE